MKNCFLTYLFIFIALLPIPIHAQFYINNFDSITLNLVGSATKYHQALRLTPAKRFQKGAMYYPTKIKVGDHFTINYRYRTSSLGGLGGGGDGIALLFQNYSPTALGNDGGGIGYSGIYNSVALEWDTYLNSEYRDPNRYHLAILSRGTLANSSNHGYALATSPSLALGYDSLEHFVKLIACQDSLWVFFDDTTHFIFKTQFKLKNIITLDSGRAWLGFTAGTGNGYENHDLLFWSFDTTVRPMHEPVVIIGGIMAAAGLYNSSDSILLATEKIWIEPNQLIGPGDNFLQVLSLANDGFTPAEAEYDIKIAPSTSLIPNLRQELSHLPLSMYANLVREIESSEQYILDDGDNNHDELEDLFVFTYDWRKSAHYNSEHLKDFIDSILTWTKYQQLKIVAHSFGGLVAKDYVVNYGSEKLSRIIFVGTPHLGAPKMSYALLTGDLSGLMGIAINHTTIKNLARNFASTYELLPSAGFFTNTGNGITTQASLYGQYLVTPDVALPTFASTADYLKNRHINQTAEFNNELMDMAISLQTTWQNINFSTTQIYNVVGWNTPTPGSVIISKNNDQESIASLFNLDGDGTVPLLSAEAITTTLRRATIYLQGVPHNKLCSNQLATKTIAELLRPTVNISTIGNPVASLLPPATYAVNTLALRVGSLVWPHAYDNQNRHTGPINDSTWETQIPGSGYLSGPPNDPEATKIIFLPPNQTYHTVVTNLLDTTAHFDFWSQTINSNATPQLTIFNNITLQNSEASAFVVLNDTSSAQTNLIVDTDGDQQFETIVNPIETFSWKCATGWNLIALPLHTEESILKLFPGSPNSGFSFKNGYFQDSHLDSSHGWWVRTTDSGCTTISGIELKLDTIDVKIGWNLIGVGSKKCLVNNLKTEPIDILSSQFFKYQTSYATADTLYPGFGYWIKMKGNGKLILR